MIIKSLSRKTPTYRQLLMYMEREAQAGFEIRQNLPPFSSTDEVIYQFESFGTQLPKRKNGNMLYHEILSVKREPGVDVKLQQKALFGMAYEYLRCRAPEQLAYGKVHVEPEHVHVHLMISPNGLDAPEQRIRLDKRSFRAIQDQMEQWMQRAYPQLKQEAVYTREGPRFRNKKATPEREYQLEKRTKASSRKRQLIWKLQGLLQMSGSPEEFTRYLRQQGIGFYTHGKHPGVIVEGRKHRLATLGLKDEFDGLHTPKEKERPQEPSPEQQQRAQEMYALHQQVQDILLEAEHFADLGRRVEQRGISITSSDEGLPTLTAQGSTHTLQELGLRELYDATIIRLQVHQSNYAPQQEQPTQDTIRRPEHTEDKAEPQQDRYAQRKAQRPTGASGHEAVKKNHKRSSDARYEARKRQRRQVAKRRRDNPELDMNGP